jgi:hypothetical protein
MQKQKEGKGHWEEGLASESESAVGYPTLYMEGGFFSGVGYVLMCGIGQGGSKRERDEHQGTDQEVAGGVDQGWWVVGMLLEDMIRMRWGRMSKECPKDGRMRVLDDVAVREHTMEKEMTRAWAVAYCSSKRKRHTLSHCNYSLRNTRFSVEVNSLTTTALLSLFP